MPNRIAFILASLVLLALVACSETGTSPNTEPEHVGTLSGMVTDRGTGQPLAGATVLLMTEEFVIRQAPNAAADGSFEFNVQSGYYSLRAGLLPDDGWCRGSGPIDLGVVSETIIDVGNVAVGAAIAPVSPSSGSTVVGAWPRLSWTPVEGAELYVIKASINSFYFGDYGTTTEAQWDWPADMPIPEDDTLISWKIYAATRDEGMNVVRFSWFECRLISLF